MSSAYVTLFTLACNNSYFAGGVCYPLRITPSRECAALMAQYGLLFRAQLGGGMVYYNDAEILAKFDETTPLSFYVYNDEAALLNHTEINLNSLSAGGSGPTLADTLFYCDNRSEPDGRLTPDFDSSAVALQRRQFIYYFDTPVTAAQLSVIDILQGACVWSMTTPEQPCSSIQINLGTLTSGRYTLQVNGTATLEFYLSKPAHPWGIIAIYLGGIAQARYMTGGCCAIDDKGVPVQPPPAYTLRMKARSTTWRYKIYSQNQNRYGNWIVAGTPARGTSGPTITFTCTNPETAIQPWIFESDQVIALEQSPGSTKFKLQPNGTSGTSVNLPYAQGQLLVLPDADAPLNGYSDIYVYL